MSTRRFFTTVVILGLAASVVAPAQVPAGTGFDYQGSLSTMGSPASGDFDFRFDLFDDATAGSMVAPTFFADDVMVADGLFTVLVDFGAVFFIDALWVEVGVREGGSTGPYTTLSPRQQVTPTPFALRATEGVGGSDALNVSSTGNVGIGTENPAEKLHVVGNIWTTGSLRAGNSIYVGETPPPGSVLGDYVTASGGTVSFDDDHLCTTGQIGIGNCAPLADLHITGTALALLGSHLSFDDAVLEDTTAWLGLYSDDAAALGSGISLGQIANTPDKWSLFRGTALIGNDDLYVTYGTNVTNPVADNLMLRIRHDTGNTLLTPWMGNVGVGETSPERSLHVTNTALPDFSAFLSAEDAIVEDSVAWLGLYSEDTGGGGIGSGITLGEIVSENDNKWAIYRRPTSNVGDLVITYGEDSNPGANTKMMQIKQDGDTLLTPVMGDVGIGLSNPVARLHVFAESATSERPKALRLTSEYQATGGPVTEFLGFKGTQIHAVTASQYSTLALNAEGGSVGIGLTSTQDVKLQVRRSPAGFYNSDLAWEDMIIEDSSNAWLGLYSDNVGNVGSGITFAEKISNSSLSPQKWSIYARTEANVGDLVFAYTEDVNPTSNTTTPLKLKRDGIAQVMCLEITGGCDIAERFPFSDKAEPGMVVEIDPENAGQLRVSRSAYNRRVAGVISGAGGLSAGAILGELPGQENAPPVALSGRVWVYCDADEQPIDPGDLLTTAEQPGHAMKVTDFAKAQGAVIGKAMTALKSGRGLVLVLVSLQ